MGRYARNNPRRAPQVRPVEKIELSEKHSKRRFYLTILFLVIGAIALVHALLVYLSKDSGWIEIRANSTQELNVSEDFVFLYELGAGEQSATAENKALAIIYSDICEQAYMMFSADSAYVELNNVYSINHNPNQVITVEDGLYHALETVQQHSDRKIYLGPVYAAYDDIFFCQEDAQAAEFDPYQNAETAAYYAETAVFAQDPSAVNIELLGENQVRLKVSDEYLSYAEANGITDFIDFSWMKNAFIADFIAQTLIEKGYTHGSISSYDGFVRNLDDRGTSYSFGIYHRDGNFVDQTAVMDYVGPMSIVCMRNYMMSEKDQAHYYEYDGGEIRTFYLDITDGKCYSAINELVCYSKNAGCADVLLQVSPLYITEEWDPDAVNALADTGIDSVYVNDGKVICTSETELFHN